MVLCGCSANATNVLYWQDSLAGTSAIPGAITQEPYTILEMARAGLMNVAGRRHVEANVEAYEDLDGTKRVRLKAVT